MPLTTFKFRRGTAATWASVNPILDVGEPGYETDTNKLKLGNGTTHYVDLQYFLSAADLIASLASTGRLTDASLAAVFAAKSVETLVTSGRLSAANLNATYADNSIEDIIQTGRLSPDQLAATIASLASVPPFGQTAGTVAQGNDSRFAADTLNASIIVETATGVWSADPPVRTSGKQKIIFIGLDDPADPTNGVDTPSRINPTDIWLRRGV